MGVQFDDICTHQLTLETVDQVDHLGIVEIVDEGAHVAREPDERRAVALQLFESDFTEDKLAGHQAGDIVVRLDAASIRRVQGELTRLNQQRFLRVTTAGALRPPDDRQVFTNSGRSLRPYAPTYVRAIRQANGDIVFKWARRTRLPEAFWGELKAPLGEVSEKYEVDVFDGSLMFKRTLSVENDKQVTYARADQIADGNGGDIGSPLTVLTVANAGFEDDAAAGVNPPQDWTAIGSGWETKADDSGHPAPYDGTYFARSSSVDGSGIYQRIDLVAAGIDTGEIDAGRIVILLRYRSLANHAAGLPLFHEALRFMDGGSPPTEISTVSGTSRVPKQAQNNHTSEDWDEINFTAVAPAGARHVDLMFIADDVATVPRPFVDGVQAWAGPPGAGGFTVDGYQVSDVLATVAGEAGRGIARRVAV